MVKANKRSNRFQRIKADLLSAPVQLCLERADLITTFFRRINERKEPVTVQKAKALRYLLQHKSVRIFADELIVGNVGRHRKSALIQPELSGVFGCQEILWIDKRKTTPFQMPWKERFTLIFKIVPYWVFRNMIFRAFYPRIRHFLRFARDQLNATYYLINEAGGIGHFLPNYPEMINEGVYGYLKSFEGQSADLHTAARIACEGLVDFADRLAREAGHLAALKTDPKRSAELHTIARICRKVPRQPAENLPEALQSLWLTHLAICLEGINSAISFGRMDQYLYPFYRRDIESGRLTPEQAKELLLCFCAKTTEHVFLLTENLSKYHGGFLVVQAAIVGGTDREGRDAVNDLTYLLMDVMEESGLRDPNFQVRLHRNSPAEYVKRATEVVKQGRGVPAFFNDETGALPSGRKAGRPFAASMGAVNGSDRLGPTALLNSVAHLDAALAANGYALNLRFDPNTLAGPGGEEILPSLVTGFFASGGMEVQFNILDPLQLQDARNHPGKYPDLVVRVAGYCAYFDDLPDVVKKEVISPTRQMQ